MRQIRHFLQGGGSRTRDQSLHIPVSDENLQAYNSMAARVELAWDLTLENHPPLSLEAILAGTDGLVDSHPARFPPEK